MPRKRRVMTEEELKKRLHKITAKELVNNLAEIERHSLEIAEELANLEVVAEIYRNVAEERLIQFRCGQC